MKNKLVNAALKSAIIYILLMTVVIIVADLYAPLKDFLKSITGHHWTAKGVLGVIIFSALTLVFNFTGKDDEDVAKNITLTIGSAIAGMVAVLIFYLLHGGLGVI